MLRKTNYGVLVEDTGTPNENELDLITICDCAKMVGIEVIEGHTAINIGFVAMVMRKMKKMLEDKK